MREVFDVAHTRGILDGNVGYRFYLDLDFDALKRASGLGGSADAFLNMAVQCLLVGYDDAATKLIERAITWLNLAIHESERPRDYARGFSEATRYQNLEMGNWLLRGKHNEEYANQFVGHMDRYLLESDSGQDKTGVSLILPGYLGAGAFQQALDRFAGARLFVPRSLSAIRNEGQMCYVFCRHAIRQEYSKEEVVVASERFLRLRSKIT